MVARVRAMVGRAGSLDEVAEGLLRLYPTLDDRRLAALIGQALALGELTGRAEIADGHHGG